MPPPLRRVLITAAADGLHLTPLSAPRSSTGSLRIEYKTQRIVENGKSNSDAHHVRVEAHGIVGLLAVDPGSAFLVAITGREQVAVVKGSPIYVVTDVALIPLASKAEAEAAVGKAAKKKREGPLVGSDTEEGETDVEEEVGEVAEELPAGRRTESTSSIGEDVIGRKGAYGRFAERWVSKRGWTADRRRSEGMSSADLEDGEGLSLGEKPENQPAPIDEDQTPKDAEVEEEAEAVRNTVTHSLTPKLLYTTRLLLAQSRSFYFSYDWDITRSWGAQVGEGSSSLPLWKRVDSEYFWNRHLQSPFIDARMTSFVLPLMQGFIGQTPFSAPPSATATPDPEPEITEEPAITKAVDFAEEAPVVKEHIAESKELKLTLTLISRRSTYRAGLRYLRRGIDEQGHTANSVETEQLLSTPTWGHVFSYLQIRGSIPLFFSQSPYSLRPRPVLLLSDEANSAAMRTHFKALQERYGGETHVVNLVEMHGSEAVVGDKFRDGVAAMNAAATSDGTSPHVGWTWFDFHSECRGMRFENVGRLFTGLDEELSRISYTTTSATTPSTTQSGILRTNCMDCLDRTNVVQSFSARLALTSQLATLGTSIAPVSDTSFNLLWADNGDAISKQYASTAALKGDFTRTRKRNLQGALTDLGLSVSRYFTNIITDFFSQATIDFLLGSVTTQVFSDFEAEMITSDPAVSLSRARLNAIEIAAKIVVADEAEEVRGGWTFLSPVATSSKHTPLVEKVLLLTDCAAYLCTYSWTLEKVEAFERVPVENVAAITMGAYITSTLAASNTDPARNVGLVISYRSDEGRDMIRVNTRSLQTMPEKKVAGADGVGAGVKFWALKAVPGAAIAGEVGVGKQELVEGVCKELVAVCEGVQEVVSKDVVGLEEAKRGTGLVERFGYAVKRLVWA